MEETLPEDVLAREVAGLGAQRELERVGELGRVARPRESRMEMIACIPATPSTPPPMIATSHPAFSMRAALTRADAMRKSSFDFPCVFRAWELKDIFISPPPWSVAPILRQSYGGLG